MSGTLAMLYWLQGVLLGGLIVNALWMRWARRQRAEAEQPSHARTN